MSNPAENSIKDSSVEDIAVIPLRFVENGVAVDDSQAIEAQSLWKDKLTLVFVARRPGCGLCREHAIELATTFSSGEYANINFVGIIKEVAGEGKVKTDEELGVNEFQVKYMKGYSVYLDAKRLFYQYLGNRSVLSQPLSSWNPFRLYSDYKTTSTRLSKKNVENHGFSGEGLVQGGIILVHPSKGVVYTYHEKTGYELPMDEIFDAVKTFSEE